MDTISKRLKDTLRIAMQDGKTYSNGAIRQLIYEQAGMEYEKDYKETHFAGCLSALKKSGEIIQVQRGEYIKGNTKPKSPNRNSAGTKFQDSPELVMGNVLSMAQIKEDILQSVRKELTYLKSVTQNIVMSFDTPEEDIQCMLKLKELVRSLEEFEHQMNV